MYIKIYSFIIYFYILGNKNVEASLNVVCVFLNAIICHPSHPSYEDALRIALLQLSCLLVDKAHVYFHEEATQGAMCLLCFLYFMYFFTLFYDFMFFFVYFILCLLSQGGYSRLQFFLCCLYFFFSCLLVDKTHVYFHEEATQGGDFSYIFFNSIS